MDTSSEDEQAPAVADVAEQQRVAAAAAAAAKQAAANSVKLSANIQRAGGSVVPPKGRMAPSNLHRTFKTRMDITCYLNPDEVEDKKAALVESLDDMLFRYMEDQQAILVAYKLLHVELHKTLLHPEPPPLLTVTAEADVVTFEPTPGDIICGVVRKLSHNSITLLVAGCVSVAIERAFIPQDWEYNQHLRCWVPGADFSRAISRGDLMTCMVMTYPTRDPEEEEVLFNLEGSLLVANTGLCDWQWPRQQRLRQLRAAAEGHGEYGPEQEAHWQKLQQQLLSIKLTRRQLVPLEQLEQLADSSSSGSGEDESESEEEEVAQAAVQGGTAQKQPSPQQQQPASTAPQLQQKQQHKPLPHQQPSVQQTPPPQQQPPQQPQQNQQPQSLSKEQRKAQKAAAKQADKAAKAAAKEQAKRKQQEGGTTPAAEQPAAKKQKKHEQPSPPVMNGHATPAGATPQLANGGTSSSIKKKDKKKQEDKKKQD